MIEFKNVCFSYNIKNQAIKNLNLEIPLGDIHGLLGHNGAGKTTLFRLILELLKPDSGEILINNKNYRNIAYMPESNGLYEKLTAFQNLEFRARSGRLETKTIKKRSNELLEKLNLIDRGNSKVGTYSNGMKKRLSLACALISNPEIILLDEPTNGVDPESLFVIRDILKDINREGSSIIISSHNLDFIEKIAGSISILENGSLVYKGEINKLNDSLDNVYIQELRNYRGK